MYSEDHGVQDIALIVIASSEIVPVDKTDSTHIAVSYGGGPDQKMLSALIITWPSGVQQDISAPQVGDIYTAARITPGNDRVLVVGRFTDNRDQVLLDTLV